MPSKSRTKRENEKKRWLSAGKTVGTDPAIIQNRPLKGEKTSCTGDGPQPLGQVPLAASSRGSTSPSLGLNPSVATSRKYPGSPGRDAANRAAVNAHNLSDSEAACSRYVRQADAIPSLMPEISWQYMPRSPRRGSPAACPINEGDMLSPNTYSALAQLQLVTPLRGVSTTAEEGSITRPARSATKRGADDMTTPTKRGRGGRPPKKVRGIRGLAKKTDQRETSVFSEGSIVAPVSSNLNETVNASHSDNPTDTGIPVCYEVEAGVLGELPQDERGTTLFGGVEEPWALEHEELNVPTEVVSVPQPRKSARLIDKAKKAVTDDGKAQSADKKSETENLKVSQRCHLKHPGFGCGAQSAHHHPEYYDSGDFGDTVCAHCGALHLKSQNSTHCCSNGNIKIQPLTPLPQEYKKLLTGKHKQYNTKNYIHNERMYNNLLRFASIQAGRKDSPPGGPVAVLLNGEFKRQISGVYAGPKYRPSFTQLYILDPKTATENRLTNPVYASTKKDQALLDFLDSLLRRVNPLPTAFMNFHEQYQKQLMTNGPDSVLHFSLILLESRKAPANIQDPTLHPRQVNVPHPGEGIFAIWSADADIPLEMKGIWLTSREGLLREIKPFHPLVDALCYPLLFPNGDDGYHFGIPVQGRIIDHEESGSDLEMDAEEGQHKRRNVSIRQYLGYRLAIRKQDAECHPIWISGDGLGQTYLLDQIARIEHQEAIYQRKAQADYRATAPKALLDYLQKGLNPGEELGRICMHRAYQPETRPYYASVYSDATIIVRRSLQPGCLNYLFTFTSNPKWPEVQRQLYNNGQIVQDRPDILGSIHWDKERMIHDEITKSGIFGPIEAFVKCLEYQKRGGPHHHTVLFSKVKATSENLDQYICAEIPVLPNPEDKSPMAKRQRTLFDLVMEKQIHSCSPLWCMKNGKCDKNFPMPFSRQSILYEDRPPMYRRRSPADGGMVAQVKKGNSIQIIDNTRVVPYNPYVLLKMQTHHNLLAIYGEGCTTRYVLKYPLKGTTACYVKAQEIRSNIAGNVVDFDEPAAYAKCHYRSANQAYGRIMSIPVTQLSHSVYKMSVHLPDQQTVFFPAGTHATAAGQYAAGKRRMTEQLAYFEACKSDPDAALLKLEDMPEDYVFVEVTIDKDSGDILEIRRKKLVRFAFDELRHEKSKRWVKRQNKFNIFGRIYPVHPSRPEEYALRCLLQHTVGVTGFDYLLTVNGHKYDTFVEAATQRGLLRDTQEWDKCMEDAAWRLNPRRLRHLFVAILYHGQATNGLELWEKYKTFMYHSKLPPTDAGKREHEKRAEIALAIINQLLATYGKSCADYGLPQPKINILPANASALNQFFFPQPFDDEDAGDAPIVADNYDKLNDGQMALIDELELALKTKSDSPNFATVTRLFFLTGSGGTGKTFLYNTAICRFRKQQIKVIPTASTGVAATLLFSGTTAHSAFRLGINVLPGETPKISHESIYGRRIREAEFIIIDEVSQLNKVVIELIEKLCREMAPIPTRFCDIGTKRDMRSHLFGGKVVLLGGDWKQSLPVVKREPLAGQVAACFLSSDTLYPHFKQVKLTQNMRVAPDEVEFCKWLESIGTGKLDSVELPDAMVAHSYQELIDHAYGPLASEDPIKALEGLILATIHPDVKAGNKLLLDRAPGQVVKYLSEDTSLKERPLDVNLAAHEVDGLNMTNPNNLPAHEIELKEGSIIMLLRNIDTDRGLCNGTRLLVRHLGKHLITVEVLTGTAAQSGPGNLVGICRCPCDYEELNTIDGIHFRRFQFPVALASVMTVNKGQGQTIPKLGLDLTHEVFAHGQLYTALSRVRKMSDLKVYAPNSARQNGKTVIRNIVADGLRECSPTIVPYQLPQFVPMPAKMPAPQPMPIVQVDLPDDEAIQIDDEAIQIDDEEPVIPQDPLNPVRLELLERNPTEWFGDEEIFAYLCAIAQQATFNGVNAIIVDSLYLQKAAGYNDIAIGQYIHPVIENYDVMLFPVHFPGHWALVIHDRHTGISTFADSRWETPSRLNNNLYAEIRHSVMSAIVQLFDYDSVESVNFQPCIVARQHDGWNCGVFTCVFAESYLFHNRVDARIDINRQRERVLRNLRRILVDDNRLEPFVYASLNHAP